MLPLAVGLALRLMMAWSIHAPWGDNGATVLELARNLSEGKGFTTLRIWTFYGPAAQFGQPEGNRQPLLPILEAGARRIGGDSFRVAQIVPLLAGLLVVVLSYRIALAVGGRRAGSLAAWFSALDPPQIYFSAQIEDQIVFTALFLGLVLWSLRHQEAPLRPWVPGVLLGALYLTRANGLLIAVAYAAVGLWRRRTRHVLMTCAAAAIVAAPWFVRNAHAFGNPFHTDNSFFLWSDGFWSVFSLRESPPTMTAYFAAHSVADIALRWLKGAYLSIEGFLIGNIFRDEPFARDSLILPLAAMVFGFRRLGRPMAFPLVAFLLHFVTIAWHAHGTYRYFIPFYALVFVGAGVGLSEAWDRCVSPLPSVRRAWAWCAALFLFLLPLARPIAATLSRSDRVVHGEAMEVVDWIERSTGPDAALMGFPIVEKYLYLYARPTVMTPFGTMEDVWRVACDYRVEYLVVSAEQLRWLPALGQHWIAADGVVLERDLPPFLFPQLTTREGMFRVYRINREALCSP
jgi:hypothetical protein